MKDTIDPYTELGRLSTDRTRQLTNLKEVKANIETLEKQLNEARKRFNDLNGAIEITEANIKKIVVELVK